MIQALAERIDRLSERLDRQAEEVARAGAAADRPVVGAPGPARKCRGLPRPDTVYAVPIAGAPFRGAKSAPVTVVRSFEFACPFSHRSLATMDQLLADYGKDIKIVYRDFVVHPPNATIPAQAACAARRQGKYFQMHDLIWTRAFEGGRDFSVKHMERLARELGLDMKRYAGISRAPAPRSCARGRRSSPTWAKTARPPSGSTAAT